jgi:hypothetical protein
VTSTAHLVLVASDRHADHRQSTDPIVGDGRPSAVRALLARSITMTAHELERRVRTRRRQPSTPALRLRWTASPRYNAGRAERDEQAARAGVVRSAVVLR